MHKMALHILVIQSSGHRHVRQLLDILVLVRSLCQLLGYDEVFQQKASCLKIYNLKFGYQCSFDLHEIFAYQLDHLLLRLAA